MSPLARIRLRKRIEAARPRLYRLAYGWTHDCHFADDLVQDTLERALSRLSELRDEDRLEVWLLRIMHNRHLDLLRGRRPMDPLDDDLIPATSSPEADAEHAQLVAQTRAAVAQLPDDQRHVLLLVDLEECSYAEAATILGIPIGTVMSRLSRARARLRGIVGHSDGTVSDARVIRLDRSR
jgi:RNA polymerase sigma-70 factor (ECF subfamily)